ncbi:uncharacterized protein LOC134542571 [Bacillus rossius redtenbacheri]|uniref:uncharacterized protein LOC134542571 n=1 Tax=Bacillus rossius redtenbacheri TaxID=93214 RepID=UPI002FDCCABC
MATLQSARGGHTAASSAISHASRALTSPAGPGTRRGLRANHCHQEKPSRDGISPRARTMMRYTACLVLVMLVLAVTEVHSIACPANYCSSVTCSTDLKCSSNQLLKPNSTTCGCCSSCVTQLVEGEYCIPVGGLGYPSGYECGSNLNCNYTLGYCVKNSA